LSEASLKQIVHTEGFHLRNLGLVQLKGKLSSINIHECFNCDAEDELQKKLNTLSVFKEGVSFYLNKSFINANNSFKKVTEKDPNDRTAKFFYNNTRQIIESGIPENKSGIVEMEEK
jgi:hypothetical protein